MKLTPQGKTRGLPGAAEQLAGYLRMATTAALRRQESMQRLGNQGPSRFVRLCQTIFYKKIHEVIFDGFQRFPINSNHF
jgi:hypothetical protein